MLIHEQQQKLQCAHYEKYTENVHTVPPTAGQEELSVSELAPVFEATLYTRLTASSSYACNFRSIDMKLYSIVHGMQLQASEFQGLTKYAKFLAHNSILYAKKIGL